MANLGTATGNIVISTAQFQEAVKEVQQGSAAMTKALAAIGIGLSFEGIKRLGEMAFELASNAAQAQETRESFNTLAASVGQNADDMLRAMRTASHGMISDQNLVLDANRAMLLGVADNADKMSRLLEVAKARGDAMGISIGAAFETLVTGLGRVSPRMLQQIGIKGGQEALDAYAKSVGTTASALSDAQQQAILFNAVMASTQPLLDANAQSGDSAADKFEQFGAKLENVKQQLGDFLLAAGATDALDTFNTAIGKSVDQVQTLTDALEKLSNSHFGLPDSLVQDWQMLTDLYDKWQQIEGHVGFQAGNALQGATGFRLGLRTDDPMHPGSGGSGGFGTANPLGGGGGGAGAGGSGPLPIPASVINQQDVINAQVDHYKKLADITKDTNKQIQQATEDAGRQRAETIRSYELGIAREEQDFGIQRQRQERDFAQGIAQMMRDAGQRDAKIQSDLNESIAQGRADHAKQLARQEEDFQTSRLRAQRDHSDDLLDAAGRLDAMAVYKSQRDFAKREQAADEDRAKQLKRDADDQADRESQERKAAHKQLDEAHQADEQRLQDMRDAFAQQKADEDADRQERQKRASDDYQHQLDEQAAAEGRRITQIQNDAAEQQTALQDAFDAQLAQLGLHNIAYEKKQKELQDQAIKDLKPFLKQWYDTELAALNAASRAGAKPGTVPQMIPAGSDFGIPGTVTTSSVNSSSRSVTIGGVSVSVSGGTNMNHDELKRVAVEALTEALEQVAQ